MVTRACFWIKTSLVSRWEICLGIADENVSKNGLVDLLACDSMLSECSRKPLQER